MFISKKQGFDVHEYKVVTTDNHELKLHRLIHPSDQPNKGPIAGKKKPYLLLHGLIGSSASFVRNVDQHSRGTRETFETAQLIDDILTHREGQYEHHWRSTADKFNAAFQGDTSRSHEALSFGQKLFKQWPKAQFGSQNYIDFDGDSLNFGREFRQAYRKFELPEASKGHISNSLAFTLSNFGYDVWLINLRGNQYSRSHNGRLTSDKAEFWDFNIDTLIREDLLAAINLVKRATKWPSPMGFISYSYSSVYILGLLTKFPTYQESLQPVIMIAPTLLTGSATNLKFIMLMKVLIATLVSQNGPFPAIGRAKSDKITRLICQLPVASKLCRLIETLLYGRVKGVGDLIFDNKQGELVRRDVDCGQTSTAVLRQIVENLSQESIHPKYLPYVEARNKLIRGGRLRRSVMLVRSEWDEIATLNGVDRIRDSALKLLTLVDFVVKETKFDHTDFLFSKRNQFLVNGEIARLASLFDFMIDRKSANEPTVGSRGY